MVASILFVARAAAIGPMSYLRPYDMAKDDLRKLQEQVERDKAAANGVYLRKRASDNQADAEAALSEAAIATPTPVRGRLSHP